jgi:hypothetical protein
MSLPKRRKTKVRPPPDQHRQLTNLLQSRHRSQLLEEMLERFKKASQSPNKTKVKTTLLVSGMSTVLCAKTVEM